jgi:hypothetical protein
VAARSKAEVFGRSPTAIVGPNLTGEMDVCLLCVLSGRGLCDGLITRPEESYRLWRVVVCDQENLMNEEAIARAGLQCQRKLYIYIYLQKVETIFIPKCILTGK